jgi:large subunit ribosomal protein L3
MSIGLVGVKCGMTVMFVDANNCEPVTVIQVEPNRIAQLKTVENDGYSSVQVTIGTAKQRNVSKPLSGHYNKYLVEPGKLLVESRLDSAGAEFVKELMGSDADSELTLDNLKFYTEGSKVDVTGISKGKGFAGVIKRHNFQTQDATHGNSLSHRAAGSIGQCQTPGRVFKGKKMAGRMGGETTTIQNLKIIKVNKEDNLIFVQGSVPGKNGGYVRIKPAVKAGSQSTEG